jgi:toxin-antitoxin system PIN domain toxin
MVPDVNVLVAASRDDHPHHRIARSWLDAAMAACADGASLKLPPLVVASFLRLVTHPRIFRTPTPMQEAIAFVDALLAVPGVDMPSAGAEWPLLSHLCLEKQLKSSSVPDAWLAATVMHLGEHLVTFDADFKKLLRRERLTVLAI